MYAIIELQGHQYKVASGDHVIVDRLAGQMGDNIQVERVLAIMDGEKTQIGQPALAKANVGVKVLRHLRGPKLDILKYKSKVNYHITSGHRQALTELEVVAISA